MSSKKARFMARMSPSQCPETTASTAAAEEKATAAVAASFNPTSCSGTPTSSSASSSSSFAALRSTDVIMGRGAQATDHKGNKRLRCLVRGRYSEYLESNRHKEKQRITHEIVKSFQREGGRFLRPVPPPNGNSNGLMSGGAMPDSWQVVTDKKVIVDKVKQMLRDVRPETELKRKLRKRKQRSDETMDASTGSLPPPPPRPPPSFSRTTTAVALPSVKPPQDRPPAAAAAVSACPSSNATEPATALSLQHVAFFLGQNRQRPQQMLTAHHHHHQLLLRQRRHAELHASWNGGGVLLQPPPPPSSWGIMRSHGLPPATVSVVLPPPSQLPYHIRTPGQALSAPMSSTMSAAGGSMMYVPRPSSSSARPPDKAPQS